MMMSVFYPIIYFSCKKQVETVKMRCWQATMSARAVCLRWN